MEVVPGGGVGEEASVELELVVEVMEMVMEQEEESGEPSPVRPLWGRAESAVVGGWRAVGWEVAGGVDSEVDSRRPSGPVSAPKDEVAVASARASGSWFQGGRGGPGTPLRRRGESDGNGPACPWSWGWGFDKCSLYGEGRWSVLLNTPAPNGGEQCGSDLTSTCGGSSPEGGARGGSEGRAIAGGGAGDAEHGNACGGSTGIKAACGKLGTVAVGVVGAEA